VATTLGILVFKETLTAWQLVGIFLVLAAIVLVQEKTGQDDQETGVTC